MPERPELTSINNEVASLAQSQVEKPALLNATDAEINQKRMRDIVRLVLTGDGATANEATESEERNAA